MAVPGSSGPPTTSPAVSDSSDKKPNEEDGLLISAISEIFPGVSAMRYLLTGQLDRLVRVDEMFSSYQTSDSKLAHSEFVPSFSITEHVKGKEHRSGNNKPELYHSPDEKVKNDAEGKTFDNPIEIALRALVDENGLGNYLESEERAVSSSETTQGQSLQFDTILPHQNNKTDHLRSHCPSVYGFRINQIKRLVSTAKNMTPHCEERFTDLIDAKILALDDPSKHVDDDQLVDELVGLSELKDSLEAAVIWSKNIDALIKEKLHQLLTKNNLIRAHTFNYDDYSFDH
ncbi:MAG: hypothetical protein Q9207_003621 [Kuettlingeria erythrocarpa]